MANQDTEFLGIDKNSGFSLRVLILSVPAGLIFLILALFDILPPLLAAVSYVCILFFNTVFLMPMSSEILQIKKYIQNLASGMPENELLKSMTEKETRELTEAINSMHKFWVDKTEMLENRTLSDAAVLDTLPDPLLMVNKTGTVIGSNLAARNLFQADLNNKMFLDFVNDEKLSEALKKVSEQKVRHTDLSICLQCLKDKPKFYIRISTLPWFAKGDIVSVLSFYDINKALKFEQMQQDFVANASHELRTPLSIIAGFIETLQTTAKDDEKAREKFLRVMSEQAVYMSALIENLLSLSKVEMTVNTKPEGKVNINAIIREIRNALELKLKENDLVFEAHFARLPHITADEAQVTQVLQNLLDNAVKYASPRTSVIVNTTKKQSIPPHRYYDVAEGQTVAISITNQGVTIAPEDLERLTERFYRLQEHKNKNIKGTGLGLAIAAQIIKRHKGNLQITSEQGVTTFTVYLPLALNAENEKL